MRMFVAVPIPDRARDDLDAFLEPRRDALDVRWVEPEQWHVTLAFLASVPDHALEQLLDRLQRAAAKRHGIQTLLEAGGAFPRVERATVLWVGLHLDPDDREELRRLSVGARAAATKSGIEVDGSRFTAHLTMARMRHPGNAVRWLRLIEGYQGPPWSIHEVSLVRSHLGQGPRRTPRYETVATFPLGRTGGRGLERSTDAAQGDNH